jgi:hypothetical protein
MQLNDAKPTVVITGPPWPRGGAARVMQSQVQFYRARGYQTIFIADPLGRIFARNSPVWDEFRDGLLELGADSTLFAAIDPRRFKLAKYTATLRHRLRGTALDWRVAIAGSAQLTAAETSFLKGCRIVLFHVNHVYTLGFALRLRRELIESKNPVPIIVNTIDIQSHTFRERPEPNPWTRRPDTEEKLLESEIAQLSQSDVLIHLSLSDFDFFQKKLPAKPHFLALPTIDEQFVSSVKALEPAKTVIDLILVGHRHAANLSAIKWFFEQVWPLIAERNYSFKIVGRINQMAEAELPQLYKEFQAHFVGEVVDLAPYYRAARCVIAPMVSGTGISIKTIEAFALGKAFVGTSKAFRGMPMELLEQLGIHAHDQPQAFADAIITSMNNLKSAEHSSQAAYDSLFSSKACFAVRDEALAAAYQQRNSEERILR